MIIILIELFALGSGQLIKIHGDITLRVFFFALMLIIGIVNLAIKRNIDKDIILFIIYLTLLLTLSAIIGLANSTFDKVLVDLKSLSYVFTIIFFYYYIRDLDDILIVEKIITKVALLLSCLYLIHIVLFSAGVYNFEDIYTVLSKHPDFRFRGTTGRLFYKGFIILPIALVFVSIRHGLISLQGICILIAIYFTETRSLWLMGVIALIMSEFYLLSKKGFKISIFKSALLLMVLAALIVFIHISFTGLSGDRTGGDSERIETIKQVFERITLTSFFVGHGLGNGVPIREIHMEMSYLEIFHKQGIIGLLIWFVFLIDSVKYLFKKSDHQDLIIVFAFTVIIVYLQSLFNPYLTNSIGIGFIVVSYVSLKRLGNLSEE